MDISATLFYCDMMMHTGSLLYLGGVAISSDLDQAGLQNFYGMDSLQVCHCALLPVVQCVTFSITPFKHSCAPLFATRSLWVRWVLSAPLR